MNLQEALASYRIHAPMHAEKGVIMPEARLYVPDEFRTNFNAYLMAMDAQPALSTTANAGIPSWLTTMIDPAVYKILFSPMTMTEILPEQRKGTWLDQTAMFPTVESEGEVSSYGDFNENGHTGLNTNWPQRQSYLYQIIKEYGELEINRAGLGRINWVSELDQAAAIVMGKFQNNSYAFGVAGLQNYGMTNDPGLSASITPATKAAGGTAWFSSNVVVATANEIYSDIQSIFSQLVSQTLGFIKTDAPMKLVMAPNVEVALTTTNSFNVNVEDLLKKNFPNMKVVTATQYQQSGTNNPYGITAGNLVQLVADEAEGQKTGYMAFNEKMRAHPIIRAMSSFKQKVTGGTWGAVIRMPVNVASMIGV